MHYGERDALWIARSLSIVILRRMQVQEEAWRIAKEMVKEWGGGLDLQPILMHEYEPVGPNETILIEDLLETLPYLGAMILVRDSVLLSKVRDMPPTIEQMVWRGLSEGLKDSFFAAVSLLFKDQYLKVEVVGAGLRNCGGKVGVVLRQATPQEIEENKRGAQHVEKMRQSWEAARSKVTKH